jgi:hypothetical protein
MALPMPPRIFGLTNFIPQPADVKIEDPVHDSCSLVRTLSRVHIATAYSGWMNTASLVIRSYDRHAEHRESRN